MKVKKTVEPKKKRTNKSSIGLFHIISFLTIVFVIAGFFFWHQEKFEQPIDQKESLDKTLQPEISVPEKTVSQESSVKSSRQPTLDTPSKISAPTITGTDVPPPPDNIGKTETITDTKDKDVEQDILSKTEGQELDKEFEDHTPIDVCLDCTQVIRDFYHHLDNQKYIKELGLKEQSEVHFTRLIQDLLNNPPVVSGETTDLYTILQNTAHFFRIIGKDNILILKGILDREKDKFENVLAHFYTLLDTQNCPVTSFSLTVPENSLYDYAGFFLNTMGGRLYLFRRDSMSRMVVSYYSILLIDQANRNKKNIHGIEIKVAIDQLINELETTTNPLQLKEVYLDNLYDLKEFYQ